jgi:hypothetical protein
MSPIYICSRTLGLHHEPLACPDCGLPPSRDGYYFSDHPAWLGRQVPRDPTDLPYELLHPDPPISPSRGFAATLAALLLLALALLATACGGAHSHAGRVSSASMEPSFQPVILDGRESIAVVATLGEAASRHEIRAEVDGEPRMVYGPAVARLLLEAQAGNRYALGEGTGSIAVFLCAGENCERGDFELQFLDDKGVKIQRARVRWSSNSAPARPRRRRAGRSKAAPRLSRPAPATTGRRRFGPSLAAGALIGAELLASCVPQDDRGPCLAALATPLTTAVETEERDLLEFAVVKDETDTVFHGGRDASGARLPEIEVPAWEGDDELWRVVVAVEGLRLSPACTALTFAELRIVRDGATCSLAEWVGWADGFSAPSDRQQAIAWILD